MLLRSWMMNLLFLLDILINESVWYSCALYTGRLYAYSLSTVQHIRWTRLWIDTIVSFGCCQWFVLEDVYICWWANPNAQHESWTWYFWTWWISKAFLEWFSPSNVCRCCPNTFLNGPLYLIGERSKTNTINDTCLKEIGLHLWMLFTPHSMMNTIGRIHIFMQGIKNMHFW